MSAIWALDPGRYRAHPLHQGDRAFPETNCYVDVWIELLHTLDLDPVACLAFTLSTDFEGDQWTFAKPPSGDLVTLYGIDVQELDVYRSLPEQVEQQVARGRPVLVEVDAFHLPDTDGTSYRREHMKTTIAVQAIDVAGRSLGYFHNGGYHAVRDGAGARDFAGLFRLAEQDPAALPPYVELVKLDRLARVPRRELAARAIWCAKRHLARRAAASPVRRFAERFEADLEGLLDGDLATFHRYAFATLRQLGACAELGAAFARWLEREGVAAEGAAAALDTVAAGAKALLFKTARAVTARRPFDVAPTTAAMATAWDAALDALDAAVAGRRG
jgi:hypothetical protein